MGRGHSAIRCSAKAERHRQDRRDGFVQVRGSRSMIRRPRMDRSGRRHRAWSELTMKTRAIPCALWATGSRRTVDMDSLEQWRSASRATEKERSVDDRALAFTRCIEAPRCNRPPDALGELGVRRESPLKIQLRRPSELVHFQIELDDGRLQPSRRAGEDRRSVAAQHVPSRFLRDDAGAGPRRHVRRWREWRLTVDGARERCRVRGAVRIRRACSCKHQRNDAGDAERDADRPREDETRCDEETQKAPNERSQGKRIQLTGQCPMRPTASSPVLT